MADITQLPVKKQRDTIETIVARYKTEAMPKQRQRRPLPINVDAVMAAVALRDELRGKAAARRQFERENATWRRITAKLVTLVVVGGCTFIVIAHAMS